MTDKEKGNVIDWLTEIVENPELWKIFYSESEQQLLAEDALTLLKEQENDIHHMGLIIEEYEKELKEQEAVVRCKDCKHRDPEDHKCDCGHDIQWQLPRSDNWFCADGEREGR